MLACAATAAAHAEPTAAVDEPNHWRLVVSPYTHHFRFNPEHRPVWAVGIERHIDSDWLLGATYFRNSFGQPSEYLYVGHRHEEFLGVQPLFVQWSAGLLHGYKGKYQTKVPLNFGGYSPGLLVSAGWKFNERMSMALHLLGDAAVMLQLAYDFR